MYYLYLTVCFPGHNYNKTKFNPTDQFLKSGCIKSIFKVIVQILQIIPKNCIIAGGTLKSIIIPLDIKARFRQRLT